MRFKLVTTHFFLLQEQICTFCNKSTITQVLKPEKEKINPSQVEETVLEIPKTKCNLKKVKKKEVPQSNAINVYSNAKDIFSLKNKKNNLATVQAKPKIKNNKKRKDKFAGLCQKAVLAAAKLKDSDDKKNKLNLFLKKSS